jgi:transcriptional regulator with XRE-family HTH domain
MAVDPLQPFGVRLRRLREESGLSRSQLSRKTATVNEGVGLPEITIKVLETDLKRQPELNTIEILAQALAIPPETFPQYKLAVIRRQLDEREPPHGVGLEQALTMLAEIEEALGYGEH